MKLMYNIEVAENLQNVFLELIVKLWLIYLWFDFQGEAVVTVAFRGCLDF